jgi:hypothetical protein
MAVAVDTPNIVSDNSSFTGTASSASVTVGASDKLLIVLVGMRYNNNSAVPPDTFTYNGVSLALLGHQSGGNGQYDASIWSLVNPASGTHTLVGSWTTNTSGGNASIVAAPTSGAATSSIFGTPATASSAANNTPAVSPTGGVAGSLYLAAAYNGIATMAGTGSGQTDISANNALTAGSFNSFDVSTITGSGSGAFTWSGSGTAEMTAWVAIGVNINAAATTTAPIAWIT